MAKRTPAGQSIWCSDVRGRGGGGHGACSGINCSCDCHNPTHKLCSKCGELKPRSEFNKGAGSRDGLRPWCRDCSKAHDKARRDALPPGSHRVWALRYHYGMTVEEYETLLDSQGGRCAICGTDDAQIHTSKRGLKGALHVDHDHKTGKVRGILCGPCNQGLGRFKDNPEALRRAAAYLDGRLA